MAKKDFLPEQTEQTKETLARRERIQAEKMAGRDGADMASSRSDSNGGAMLSDTSAKGSRQLTDAENAQIAGFKDKWQTAYEQGDTEGMQAAHESAEAVRAGAGFSGGADGSEYIPLSAGTTGGVGVPSHGTALLNDANPQRVQEPTPDTSAKLAELEKEIQYWKDEWARQKDAGNREGMDAAHLEAEKLRAKQGYLGGEDGSDYIPIVLGKGNKGEDGTPRQQLSAIDGGYSVDDVMQWLGANKAVTSDGHTYHNGFSADMNKRSRSNFIRQQMLANSEAWANADAAQREYLHDQNAQLAGLLEQVGGDRAKSTFNESLGRWETADGNLGYGYVTNLRDPSTMYPDVTPMTAEEREYWATYTDRYQNYVDYDLPLHWMDNSSGFTGTYENFIDGPYWQLISADALGRPNRATYTNLIGDGFMDEYDYTFIDGKEPTRDENGDYILYQPMRKNNNRTTDYTKGKASYVDEYGIIQPGSLDGTKYAGAENNMYLNGGTPVENPDENFGVTWGTAPTAHTRTGGSFRSLEELGLGNGSGNGAGSYEEQINAQYDADLQSKLSALEQEYDQALAELERSMQQINDEYTQQRRQTAGTAERDAAAQREIANAQGVSSGAIGQTDLVNRGQMQSQMNAMYDQQAQKLAAIEQQMATLAQTYQLQIQQAEAENDYARAQALLQEAQRVEEVMRQQQQQQTQMMLSLLGMMGG